MLAIDQVIQAAGCYFKLISGRKMSSLKKLQSVPKFYIEENPKKEHNLQ